MSADEIKKWLAGGKYAQIGKLLLRPLAQELNPTEPLCIQKGQAATYVLNSPQGQWYFLKKFHAGRLLDRGYLEAVGQALPLRQAFQVGHSRQILTADMLSSLQSNTYYSRQLGHWLDSTVLMGQAAGKSWASLTDELREGRLLVHDTARWGWCRKLAEAVLQMEACQISHRDLSAGNVYLDLDKGILTLIDFDSLYHPSLTMPAATTIGTEGYCAPFQGQDRSSSGEDSWCPQADRFALTILCVEFLLMDARCQSYHDGGLFAQEDLYARRGDSLKYARKKLRKKCPPALDLWERALQGKTFAECPGPADWLNLCTRMGVPGDRYCLDDMEPVNITQFRKVLEQTSSKHLPRKERPLPELVMPEFKLPPEHPSYDLFLSDPAKRPKYDFNLKPVPIKPLFLVENDDFLKQLKPPKPGIVQLPFKF